MRTYENLVSSIVSSIWEGLRRLYVEIKGKRFLEELTEIYFFTSSRRCLLLREQVETETGKEAEKLCGVDSKYNERGPFIRVTQFRLLFLHPQLK